jgi:hypothetical protein
VVGAGAALISEAAGVGTFCTKDEMRSERKENKIG